MGQYQKSYICVVGVPGREEKGNGPLEISAEIMRKYIPKIIKSNPYPRNLSAPKSGEAPHSDKPDSHQ